MTREQKIKKIRSLSDDGLLCMQRLALVGGFFIMVIFVLSAWALPRLCISIFNHFFHWFFTEIYR